jgi:hypothetical protein
MQILSVEIADWPHIEIPLICVVDGELEMNVLVLVDPYLD